MSVTKSVKSIYKNSCLRFGAFLSSPGSLPGQAALFLLGLGLLTAGLVTGADAQRQAVYNDDRLASSVNVLLMHIEGSFGILIMVTAGIAAIMSSAFGQYRAALALLVVSVGSFILRSIIGTFFNDDNIMAG